MKILDMIKMCLQNLTRRKSRTILTVLGVVVGCCAIVTMMSIGFGVQNSQQIMLEGMGDLTLIQVYSSDVRTPSWTTRLSRNSRTSQMSMSRSEKASLTM